MYKQTICFLYGWLLPATANSLLHTIIVFLVAISNMAATGSTSCQGDEIANLKTSYEGQVKVISGIGDFTNVVTIQHRDVDIQCKFQLTVDYPLRPPTISIRSSTLTKEQATDLTSHLQTESEIKVGAAMLADLMAMSTAWVVEQNIDMTVKPKTSSLRSKKTKKSKGNKQKADSNQSEEVDSFIKKPPMKTAADVIKRLQWDKSVDVNEFIVGYMDRITGLEEKAFTAFTWEDLASVDQFCLAIPQHRIQYFKYKTEKVWDKNERLDNVFGSTGSKTTIVETVAKYERSQQAGTEKTEDTDDGGGGGESATAGGACEGVTELGETDVTQEQCETHDEQATLKDEPKWEEDTDVTVGTEKTNIERQEQMRTDSVKRPNYFVAFQITDSETVQQLKDIQRTIIAQYPQYEPHAIPENGFHLTLSVLRLDDNKDIATCVGVMDKLKPDLVVLAKHSGQLSFTGIDHFSPNVLFAKVKHTNAFLQLVDTIKYRLIEAGINIHMDNGFIPHLTLFKVRRSASRDINWKRENLFLQPYSEIHFGSQPIDNVQVCEMGTLPRNETGDTKFYTDIFKLEIFY